LKYPLLTKWVNETIRGRPELNDGGKTIIKVPGFQKWIEELVTLPLGKKPPLRVPMQEVHPVLAKL
jgi:hypothetical protein